MASTSLSSPDTGLTPALALGVASAPPRLDIWPKTSGPTPTASERRLCGRSVWGLRRQGLWFLGRPSVAARSSQEGRGSLDTEAGCRAAGFKAGGYGPEPRGQLWPAQARPACRPGEDACWPSLAVAAAEAQTPTGPPGQPPAAAQVPAFPAVLHSVHPGRRTSRAGRPTAAARAVPCVRVLGGTRRGLPRPAPALASAASPPRQQGGPVSRSLRGRSSPTTKRPHISSEIRTQVLGASWCPEPTLGSCPSTPPPPSRASSAVPAQRPPPRLWRLPPSSPQVFAGSPPPPP